MGSDETVKSALLAANSIGYSSGPSGVYLVVLFHRMGIAESVRPKLKQTPLGVAVGELIARGDAEIGFQQVSELIHFPGIDFVGPLPPDIQQITVFSIARPTGAANADAAAALVKFLTSPSSAAVMRKNGLEPG